MKPAAQYLHRVIGSSMGVAIIGTLGVCASIGLLVMLRMGEQANIRQGLARRASTCHALIREDLNNYVDALGGLRLLFEYSGSVSLGEFDQAAADVHRRVPDILAIHWAPYVTRADRASFEAAARRRVAPDYFIFQTNADGQRVPASERDTYVPILYTFPPDQAPTTLGLDALLRPSAADLTTARITGRTTLTPRFRLLQGFDGFVMVCPVRKPGRPEGSADGFLQIVVGEETLHTRLQHIAEQSELRATITDVTVQQKGVDTPVFRLGPPEPAGKDAAGPIAGLVSTETLHIGERLWRIDYRPIPVWNELRLSSVPLLAMLAGLVFTAFTTLYLRASGGRAQRIARDVAERTAQLDETRRRLEDDIRARERAESLLREKQRQLDGILGKLPGMAYLRPAAPAAPPAFISQGCQKLTGHHPDDLLSGRVGYFDLVHPEDRERCLRRLDEILSTGATDIELEYRLRDRDGNIHWVLDRGSCIRDDSGRVVAVEGLVVDITDLRRAQEESLGLERKILESQKYESLGALAGGIAHDFNNLLTSILGNASLARITLPPDSPVIEQLRQVEQSAIRAADLCQQMLAYSGRGRLAIESVDIGQIVGDSLHFLKLTAGKKADIHLDLAPSLPGVIADAAQIRQVLVNLVSNAADAIGEKSGRITLRTEFRQLDRAFLASCVRQPDIPVGPYVCLTVEDNGCGIADIHLPRIFEPFFTTKYGGRGLGLAAVLGIVRGHQGAIRVESTLGRGSTFSLFFPPAAQAAPAAPAAPAGQTSMPWNQTARVLVVDDDENILNLQVQILRTFGMQVDATANGEDALATFRRNPDAYDLVLVDLTLPGMNGDELLGHLRAIRPAVRALLISGYDETEALARFGKMPDVAFLQKPFGVATFKRKIQSFFPPQA